MLPRCWRQVKLGVKRGDQTGPNQLPQGSGDCDSPARQFQGGLVQRVWYRSHVGDCTRAATAGVTPRTIYQWVEAGRVHFSETARGETLICLNSLSAAGGH